MIFGHILDTFIFTFYFIESWTRGEYP